jgi:uncharacterized protein
MIILLAVIFFILFGGVNYYIGLRGWQNVGNVIPIISNRVYWLLFWCISMSYLIARLIGKYLPSALNNTIEMVGAYWLAVMFYLLMILFLFDVLRLMNRKFDFLPHILIQNTKSAFIVSTVVIIGLTALMIYGTWNGRNVVVTKYKIQVGKTNNELKSLKIVIISDLHLGNIVDNSRLTTIIDRINKLQPDMVLIPGDIIDDVAEPFVNQRMDENFKRLRTKYGVYASLGNHDGMLQSADKTASVLKKCGIEVVRDKAILIDNSFYIVGRDDETTHRGSDTKRKTLVEILKAVDQAKPIIVMDHQPKQLDIAEKEGVDLQVSGHTHKGQIFPSNLITSRIYEKDYGMVKKGKMTAIISSGVGTWGPPIRIGSKSEIVEILLTFSF